ncbi:MAG: hypothetical protein VYE53_09480, partial [Planctomycetota bacterium]|nr:hypothetical protein [Planctomycetota bacterium]
MEKYQSQQMSSIAREKLTSFFASQPNSASFVDMPGRGTMMNEKEIVQSEELLHRLLNEAIAR